MTEESRDVRIFTYDEEDLVDIEEEIDLSDIFDDEKEDLSRTMVADREAIKAGLAEAGAGEEEYEEEAEEEKQVPKKHRKHRHSHLFIELFLLLIAAGALIAFAMSPFFTIRHIRVEGNRFYTDEQIINMSEAKTGGNLFRNAQKSLIRGNLRDNNYFRSVRVRRSIPDTLVIEVEEKEELAALIYGDRYIVIDDNAEVLRIAKIDPEVTVLEGLTIKDMTEGSVIRVEEKKVFSDTLATLHAMKEGDFYFKHIIVSRTKVEAYINDMMKVDGTSAQLRESIETGTLQKVVNKLMKNKIKRGTIILGDNNYISFSPAV